ncbi:hypothetical protein [Desulfosporosinus youngiae]|uniref:Uncharacterized protein n=1 Tax=Desulfosporosinus youngiae DSM 17734 TaxID=768710 RepID=H5Y417_9FIRM|nr:hypothetical protein [Desulfosporosinus youngiae]EHQ89555.1 hypothetical protein DesyoDRAFT_2482 [Desulfosporosinus youngiae DSM 17734]
MKNKILVTGVFLLLVLAAGGYWVYSERGETTVYGAIEKTGRRGSRVIYQEKVKGGVVVFTKRLTGDSNTIDAGYVKKGLFGWKWILGGGFSGHSGQYFQAVSGTPFPMLVGTIDNDQTTEIKVTDSEHRNSKDAKIVGTGDDRIWFVFVNESDGPAFEIDTLSDSGNVLNSKTIDIRTSTTF